MHLKGIGMHFSTNITHLITIVQAESEMVLDIIFFNIYPPRDKKACPNNCACAKLIQTVYSVPAWKVDYLNNEHLLNIMSVIIFIKKRFKLSDF